MIGWRWLVVVCAFGSSCSLLSAQTQSQPNFLVILADDMGFSDAGCYGGEIQTPNLNRLANNGLRFTQFYNTARCWPTRGAMLTGYYAQQIRRDAFPDQTRKGQGTRPSWAKLCTEKLRKSGYRNYHSGKWHIDGKPLENGFDHSLEIGGGQNNFFNPKGITIDDRPIVEQKDFYVTTTVADHAIECLREHSREHASKPFFQYVAFTSPHFPLHAKQEDIDIYRKIYREGWDHLRAQRYQRLQQLGIIDCELSPVEREVGPPYDFPDALVKLGEGEVNRPLPWDTLTGKQKDFQATKMAIHAAMIHRMDIEIGRIIGQIESMGKLDETLILFLSDNGASAEIMVRGGGHDPNAPMGSPETYLCLGPGWSNVCNTPFRRHKTWVHEGGISTPLIAHWPKGISAKSELRKSPGHVIDIAATLLELGAPNERGNQEVDAPPSPSESLVPLFQADRPRIRSEIWWSHEGNRAFRLGDWKIVASGKDAPWQLYDLRSDRSETKDLATAHPEKVDSLNRLWRSKAEEFAIQSQ